MARPKLSIDKNVVAGMAFAGASNVDIADFVGCAESTIRGRYCEILTKQRAGRRIKLRQLQWRAAEKGNATMLIFLGKQELGQRDVVEYAPLDTSKMSDEELEAIASGKGRAQLRLHR
jgi:hypothetical protein